MSPHFFTKLAGYVTMKNTRRIFILVMLMFMSGCLPAGTEPPLPYDNIDATETSSNKYSKYIVYHFGATWCPPCKQMIKLVWKDKEVIDELDKHSTKLIILDADKEEHKKYFKYYKIGSYPTIVILNRGDLKTAIIRSGYMKKSSVLSVIRKKLL